MIIAAAERGPDLTDDTQRSPVQPDFSQRRTDQAADEDEIAATLGAKQFDGPPELADRYPVMTKTLHPCRIASAPEREQDRIHAACGERVRDRERHRATGCDQADR